MSIKLSLIELGARANGQAGSDVVKNIITTAQKAEEWGYHRIWLGEHHNTANFISLAPEVTIPLVASNTSHIRVGSGAVLLNHYSPFKVAEVFTLLGDMFPGRIDMGIGRATTGPVSDFALQRNRSIQQRSDDSEEQLVELLNWLTDGFEKRNVFSHIKAHYGTKNLPEFWLLGSSQWSAYAAGSLGLNYSFAGFINPGQAYRISQVYRDNFSPAKHHLGGSSPRLMLSLNIYCADTPENAGKLAAPMIVMMQRLRQGDIKSPMESEENAVKLIGGIPRQPDFSDPAIPSQYLIGTAETIHKDLIAIADTFGAEEIMIQCISNNLANRLKCLKLLSEIFR
ncbi:MAG: MsnO8 family LLM class oxidoreductase [Proteiniphilum sp.]|uniref:MsnO8 family LLM class oxidoreductase n=1 Tax=Proteiniphilum sp. TaxID=1926877 RepID=UPI002B20669D|nr:MsnO8 family LLM class oxidoreductase [Proteiniphilum sp.]MEA5126588.1 MsnO8 family LLM class oxidoreductase [Proteiniphilum sp.]